MLSHATHWVTMATRSRRGSNRSSSSPWKTRTLRTVSRRQSKTRMPKTGTLAGRRCGVAAKKLDTERAFAKGAYHNEVNAMNTIIDRACHDC